MMRNTAIASICLGLLVSQAVLARAPAQIDAVVLDEMARQNIVGMAVGIVRNGKLYYANGYGHADLARNIPITTESFFRWGSVSKTLTATATLRLAEVSPAFSLDDYVAEHVDYWPAHGDKGAIRIRHLLSNRSGIIHYRKKKHCPGNPSPGYARNRHTSRTYDARQAVDIFKHQPLCFDPGTHYKYSTFGYSLLGSAIEGGSGTRYANWINDTVRAPLGLSSLRQATGTSRGFDQQCHILQPVIAGNAAWKLPGGGWESNIIDLARFANGLLQGRLLNRTSRLWATVEGNPSYGYGVKYTPDKREVWHEGKHNNTRTLLYLYPGSSDRLGIVLMINGIHCKPRRIAHHLADLFGRDHNDSHAPVIKSCDRACAGRFSAVWHRTGDDVLLRRGYRHDAFDAERSFLRQAGYYTDDFEPYVRRGEVVWDAIFRKGSGASRMRLDSRFDRFERKAEDLSSQGYRLVDLETHVIDGLRYWTGLFRPGAGDTVVLNGMPADELATRNRRLSSQGYGLIDIEPYSRGGHVAWAGVWQTGQESLFEPGMTSHDFARPGREQLKKGYRLIDIEAYREHGRLRWAGLWEPGELPERWAANREFCTGEPAAYDGNRPGISDLHNLWRGQEYELNDWERD